MTSCTAASAGRSRRSSIWREACCGRWARDGIVSVCTGRTSRARRRVDVLGSAAPGEPALERAGRARRQAGRPRGDHPAPAAGDRDRAYRVLSDGRGGDAAFDPVRPRRARVPPAEQRAPRRVRRRSSLAEPRGDRAIGCPTQTRDRRGGAREAGVIALGAAARAGLVAVHSRRDVGRGPGAPDLHERHDRPAERRAEAAARACSEICPGFEYSHDLFPQAGDLFWSPADWAWTGGLMDALLPTLYYGQPILGYRGRFDPERAFHLMREVPGAQHVSVSDRAQDDDEGGAGAARALSTSSCARS